MLLNSQLVIIVALSNREVLLRQYYKVNKEMYQVVHDKEAEILERETYKNIETGRTINKKCMKIY